MATFSVTLDPTAEDFPNPERGFYGWAGADLVTDFDATSLAGIYASGKRLALAIGNIGPYRTVDIPQAWLTTFSQSLDALRDNGLKVTLLFEYNNDASGVDATAAQITRHLEQLAPVLAAHAETIPYMRAGFIGAWGEWHSSTSGNSCGYNAGNTPCSTANANRLLVRDALLAHVPSTTQVAFRYPPDLMRWYPDPLQQQHAGMHNDCFLAGPTDTGTYADETERTYAASLSSLNAFGGETCDADMPMRTSCQDILSEGARYHVAWLNADYHPTFMDRWRADGCYSQVSSLLGYRLQVDGVSHPESATRGGNVDITVDLRNVGWARMFGQPRPLVVKLRRGNNLVVAASPSTLQQLPPQATASTRITVGVSIPANAPAGSHDLLLCAPDPSPLLAGDARFAVRFANADVSARNQAWEAGPGCFRTGSSITVD